MCACVYALKIVSADTILRFIKTLTVLNYFFKKRWTSLGSPSLIVCTVSVEAKQH